MNPKEYCIECGRYKTDNDKAWFCESCRKKMIDDCTKYHNKLQESYR